MNLEITDLLLGLLANGVRFYAIKRFIDIFLSRDECRWKHIWVLYVIACIWTSLIYWLFMSPTLNIISNLIGFLLLVLPYRVKLSRKLLVAFMIYVVNLLVDSIVVISFTKYIVGEPVKQIYECVTSLVILLIAILLERTILAERDINLPMFYRIALCLVPVISIACIYYMVMTAIDLKMTVVVVAASVLLINILDFYLYNSLVQFCSARMEKKMFEQMVEVYAYQLDVVRESQERVVALRHDMKHHIIELSSMINENENPEMMKYLRDMGKFMLNPEEHVSTGNKEIDGVLNYMLQKADAVLSHVDIKINVPEKICWTDFNICVILGNLVDNAIREASKSKEKYLEIDIQSKQGIMLIFVENSYSGEIVEADNKFRSSQKELAIHGIGLENVKKVVQANGGEMNIDYADNRFKVQVLLYLSNIK
ncbi:MAG: GHKL domain-containing protein [Eubacteriales bacterium]|nr:GHKL domain-containing protein [Eubacteriales bacterium]